MALPPEQNVPVPDPSVLTTEQLRREVLALREFFEVQLKAMATATALYNANAELHHQAISEKVTHLKELHEEKFEGIQTQFKERDTRVDQTAKDTKVAVDAALQAAEKAVGKQNDSSAAAILKSEAATGKQLDGLVLLLKSTVDSMNEKVSTINGRLDRGDGNITGRDKSQASGMTLAGMGISFAALIVSIGVGLFAIFGTHTVTATPPQIVVAPPASISEATPAEKK